MTDIWLLRLVGNCKTSGPPSLLLPLLTLYHYSREYCCCSRAIGLFSSHTRQYCHIVLNHHMHMYYHMYTGMMCRKRLVGVPSRASIQIRRGKGTTEPFSQKKTPAIYTYIYSVQAKEASGCLGLASQKQTEKGETTPVQILILPPLCDPPRLSRPHAYTVTCRLTSKRDIILVYSYSS